MLTARKALLLLLAIVVGVLAPAATAGAKRHHHHRRHHHRHHHRRHHRAHSSDGIGCVNADTPAVAASKQEMRAAVVCLINHQRISRGLSPLHEVPRLTRSAQRWTNSMVRSGVFSHGSNFSGRISATGYNWDWAGENIASGFRTPRGVVRAWMASTEHCQNILNPHFADVGTGVIGRPVGDLGGNDLATWTQDFGLWTGHRSPSGNGGPQRGCPY